MNNLKDYAELYASEGFNPVPLNSDKSPLQVMTGTNYLYEPVHVDDRFNNAAKIGITCGTASKGLEVIDFDCHDGEDIESIFNDFMSDDIVIQLTTTGQLSIYKTPSGGFHVAFLAGRYFGKSSVLSRWSSGKVMIEVRAGGSYVACYPSQGYEFLAGSELVKLEELERDNRNHLINLATSYNKVEVEKKQGTGVWGEWDNLKPWGRFNEEGTTEVKALLIANGWRLRSVRSRDGVELWQRPGKLTGISATFGQYRNMFYFFSSNALPFQENKAYSCTDILMHLQFSGDWQATKDHLRKLYAIVEEPQAQTSNQINFPLWVLPDDVQQYIGGLRHALNYKEDFLAVAFMFTVASLNGNKYKLRVKNGWTAATTFWFAVVGESGVMKSHPINQMVRPIKTIDKASKKHYDALMEDYNRIDEKDRKRAVKPKFRQILIEDFTLESAHHAHDTNKRGLGLHKDELVGFLNDMNKYRKGSDEQFWLESFNNSSYIVNRVTKEPLMIDNIMINIIGSIQPSVLNEVAGAANGNGLVERFLYTTSESNIYPISVADINPDWIKWYDSIINNIEKQLEYIDQDDTVILEMTPEAFRLFVQQDSDLCDIQKNDNETSGMRNYINKIKTYMPRFALLMCIMQGTIEGTKFEVTAEHMKRASALSDYFISSARSIFQDGERSKEASIVKRAMNSKGMTKIEQIVELKSKGFSQVEIAKQLNTPASYVSRILKNRK